MTYGKFSANLDKPLNLKGIFSGDAEIGTKTGIWQENLLDY